MKIELKHLAPYLPYGLKIQRPDRRTILTLYGLCGELMVFKDNTAETYGSVIGGHSKPILRPMSDLGNTINHNGKIFIPIVELFNTNYASGAYDIVKIEQSESSCSLSISWDKIRSSIHRFCYVWYDGSFLFHNSEMRHRVGHQFEMFNKLYKWHFDVFGLIDTGLAIDINTVPELLNG